VSRMETSQGRRAEDRSAVLRMADRGWRLFPIKPRGKQPLIDDWPRQATHEGPRLETWMDRFPGSNWGVITGPESGMFVLDVDGDEGHRGIVDLERRGCVLPKTLTTRTGHGTHAFLEWPGNGAAIRNSASKLAPGLDVRGAGGYVVVPPSVHPSGATYNFIDENVQIASAPELLLQMLTQISATAEPCVGVAELRGEIIPEGQRNDTLFRHAISMWHRRMTRAAVEAALLAENARCVPPLDESEVREIARSAYRYEQAPRSVRPNVQTGLRQWPTALAQEAFHGVAGEFVRLIRPETEADDAALLFSFLVTLGSIIGRGPYYQVGGDRHYTNLFTVIVGESAKARKGTSWGELHRFVELVDEQWCKERVAGGLSSGEGLIYAVRDPIVETVAQREGKRVVGYESQTTDAGVDDKRLLAVESEFTGTPISREGREHPISNHKARLGWGTAARTRKECESGVLGAAHFNPRPHHKCGAAATAHYYGYGKWLRESLPLGLRCPIKVPSVWRRGQ
jgi:hypothetical protein